MMKRILFCISLIFGSLAATFAAKVSKEMTIEVGGETRSYWLHVPTSVKANAPLVFSLHGTGGHCTDKSPFGTDVADANGCIVVYPQGESIYFPVFGGYNPGWHSTGVYTKDIDFFKAIIEEVNSKYPIDRKRIYCCGFSNGGMMTYTVANVASDIFAAFASISGFPLNEFHLHTTSPRPYPFLHIHGKNDDFVKYSLMPNIVDNTVARNGCNPVPEVKTVSGKYKKSVYAATEGSFPYIYYEIEGMGHSPYTDYTEDGNSSKTMWKFFKQYTLDTYRDETLKWRPNIEQEGWTPKSHGWTVTPTAATLVSFGKDVKSDANQNAYRALQFEPGYYRLDFHAEGAEGKPLKVKIQKIGKTVFPLNAEVLSGGDISLSFQVTGDWAEYKFTISHDKTDGEVNISKINIHAIDEAEFTAIRAVESKMEAIKNSYVFNLAGQHLPAQSKGLLIKGNRKVVVK